MTREGPGRQFRFHLAQVAPVRFLGRPRAIAAKGGFERVSDYGAAIDDCLAQLKQAGAIAQEERPGRRRVQDHDCPRCEWLRATGRIGASGDGGLQRPGPGAQSAVHQRHPVVRGACRGPRWWDYLRRPFTNGHRRRRVAMRCPRRGMNWGSPVGVPRGEPQVHRRDGRPSCSGGLMSRSGFVHFYVDGPGRR
jgi:hypothetical protein